MQIVLTEDQAKLLAQAQEAVEIRDPKGNWVGRLDPREAHIVSESRKRLASSDPRIPGHKVQAHLTALQEEWDRTGGFDKEYMHAFLDKLNEQDRHEMLWR